MALTLSRTAIWQTWPHLPLHHVSRQLHDALELPVGTEPAAFVRFAAIAPCNVRRSKLIIAPAIQARFFLNLVTPDGSLRNAAVELLCEGSDTYPRMKLGLLGDNTKAKILDLRRECGTMLKLLDFAEHFVASNIR